MAETGTPVGRSVLPGFEVQAEAFASAVLDEVTTDICRTYHGVTLPISHPWFLSHWSPNHWGCRGVVVPAK